MPYNNLTSRADVQAMIREAVSEVMLTGLNTESSALAMFTRINVPTNQTRFPVISALPNAYFVNGDTGLKQTTEMAWSNKYLDIEELAAIAPVPDAVLDDAGFDIIGTIRPLLQQAISRKLDAAVFFGTSKPTAWPTGVVPAAVAAGNVVARGTNNAAAGGIAEDINDLLATMEADGYVPTGFVGNPLFKTYLRGARGTDGQLLMDVGGNVNTVWGLPIQYPMPALWPSGVSAAELIALQRENFIIGVRQDFTFTMHRDGVISDEAGNTIINLMQQDMTAIRVVFRVGWQVSNPLNYQEATEANRYPAAVLRSPAS